MKGRRGSWPGGCWSQLLYCQTRSAGDSVPCSTVQCRQTSSNLAPRCVSQVAVVDDGGGSGGGPMSQVLPACVPQGSQRHSAKNATRARAGVGLALALALVVPRH